jgi:Mg-chelatase subunit ChlI
VLPFAAYVGQPRLRAALLLLAVEPRLQGLLIRGERGSGKTTAARGLADLLPRLDHRPAPFATLPLGATEDQVAGSFELEAALQTGRRRLSPGLLARAHGGVLYVDEVNLLPDHLVDLLLDVAASGVNVVAREGLQTAHPARFLLVGTMNPEEGELRPQLTDRFGLCVALEPLTDRDQRVTVMERALAFEQDPRGFATRYAAAQDTLRRRILAARRRLPDIAVSRAQLAQAAGLSLSLQAAGHRADLLVVKAARALAALDERGAVSGGDLADAAELVFYHRLPATPFDDEAPDPIARIQAAVGQAGLAGSKKKSPVNPVRSASRLTSDPER